MKKKKPISFSGMAKTKFSEKEFVNRGINLGREWNVSERG